ncbi:MAG TPA: transcription termination/antitermination protein NusG [Acidobacteriota bacterium]|nr:transcription termination/antitermination protein NusG [Acidobacteriota bacterium]
MSKKWFVIHTYSGYENKVVDALKKRVKVFGLDDQVGQILIPTQKVLEMKSGKKVETEKKFYPGYILVEMEMSDDVWHAVVNTPKVSGFVGSGRTPTPLSEEEVDQIVHQISAAAEKPAPMSMFDKGETIKIIDGPFSNFTGQVEEVNPVKSTLKVMVTIFGRATPVELDFLQVEKIQ